MINGQTIISNILDENIIGTKENIHALLAQKTKVYLEDKRRCLASITYGPCAAAEAKGDCNCSCEDKVIEDCGCSEVEEMNANQKKLDKNHNGKLDSQDFKIIRGKKKKQTEQTEPIDESAEIMFGGVVAATAATILGPMIADLYRSGKDALARRAGKEWDSQSEAWVDIRDWQSKELNAAKSDWDKLFKTAFAQLENLPANQKNALKEYQRRFNDILGKAARIKTATTGPLAREGHKEFQELRKQMSDLHSDVRYWAIANGLMNNSGGSSSSSFWSSRPSGGDGISSS
jgi:hypothetical protein